MRTRERGSELGRVTAEQQENALAPDAALGALFVSSPARRVRTSAASETAFVAALVAIVTVPFSATLGLATILAAVALLTSILGLARSSRPAVAGSLLAAVGLVLALTTLAIVGLRYLGIDIAIADPLAGSLPDWLATLNALLPTP